MKNILVLLVLLVSIQATAFDYTNQFRNRDEPFPNHWRY